MPEKPSTLSPRTPLLGGVVGHWSLGSAALDYEYIPESLPQSIQGIIIVCEMGVAGEGATHRIMPPTSDLSHKLEDTMQTLESAARCSAPEEIYRCSYQSRTVMADQNHVPIACCPPLISVHVHNIKKKMLTLSSRNIKVQMRNPIVCLH